MEQHSLDLSRESPLERSTLLIAIALILLEPLTVYLGGASASISRLLVGETALRYVASLTVRP
ncbi:hypothetical protein KJ781_00510 [Patescibacteria group bacterium]|nr:hypothetical protein [Patescibacteria group bacterium]MBU1448435.1 hypothetical protein [Patescibacteria group bacterium]MBU2612871.1 hypothetical protein [Patescibacteria group bacterium]